MKYAVTLAAMGLVLALPGAVQAGNVFNGTVDYATEAYGNYAVLTGGLFTNGQTTTSPGRRGVMMYIHDEDPHPFGSYPGAYQQWKRDGWFDATAGMAVTLRSTGSIVYDNNGIDTGTYPTHFYGNASDPSQVTPGLYCGYSMSDNLDWTYAGYFRLEQETTFDQISGYFAQTYYAPIDLTHPFEFNINIYSAVDGTGDNAGYMMPYNTGAFRGDVFSDDLMPGTFSVADSGQVRHYDGFDNNDDIIYRLTYTLDTPVTLPEGEYFFSHDAQVVPEPVTMAGLVLGIGSLVGYLRRRRGA